MESRVTTVEASVGTPPWQDALDHLSGAKPRRRATLVALAIVTVVFVFFMIFVGLTAPQAKAVATGYPGCTDCRPPMTYSAQSPVMGGGPSGVGPGVVTVTPVYWTPPGTAFDASYRSILDGFIANVAQASGEKTNVFSILPEYSQNVGPNGFAHLTYHITAGPAIEMSTPIPSKGHCVAGPDQSACVTDDQLQTALLGAVQRAKQPVNDGHLYVVFLPSGVQTCDGAGRQSKNNQCSNGDYCGTHSALQVQSSWLVYATMPYADPSGCVDPNNGAQSPSGNSYADTEVNTLSHEMMEAITDYAGAWSDANGNEIGDICGDVYAPVLGVTNVSSDNQSNGTMFNQRIGTGRYYIQDEFSNAAYAGGKGDQAVPDNSTTIAKIKGCVGKSNRG